MKIKDSLIPILALMLICLGMTAFMAYVYNLTLPVVELNEAQGGDYAGEIFPDIEFEEVEIEGALEAQKASSGESVILMEASGYNKSTPIEVAIGFEADGSIKSVIIVSCNETVGVGTQVEDEEYLAQFAGKANADSADLIAGATFSSRAVSKAVTLAAELNEGM